MDEDSPFAAAGRVIRDRVRQVRLLVRRNDILTHSIDPVPMILAWCVPNPGRFYP